MDSLVSDLMKTLLGLGPGGVIAGFMFYQWREERSERRSLQDANTQLLRDKITSDNALTSVLDRIATKVGA
jgi:hypothetical protein